MLARIAEERDVDAVVVHKIDRFARNMEDQSPSGHCSAAKAWRSSR